MSDNIRSHLHSLGVKPHKSRGQNFLIDADAVQKIIEFANPGTSENILEIGPGTGVMTRELAMHNLQAIVEIEPDFCKALEKEFPNLKIINEDVRFVDFSQFGSNLTIFGNLPYSFSTDITMHMLANAQFVKRAIFLLQKEFSERLAASPGGKDYGSLTLAVQLHADVVLGPIIMGDSFYPVTKVQSQVVELRFLKAPRFQILDHYLYSTIIAAAFRQRRKKLKNTLKSIVDLNPNILDEALKIEEIDPMARPENVSLEAFVGLANRVFQLSN